jgi:rod shape-determining protein MreC
MPHFSNKKLIVGLISVIFLVALISFSLRDRHNATFPERIIKDTVGFAQGIVAKPTNYIIGKFEDMNALFNTYDENKRLKSRLEEFAVLQSQVNTLETENESLRELVDVTESLRDADPLYATVIARNPDQWEEKIILNKGSAHGIKKNMAVTTARGLIGKVTVVTNNTSEVELLYTNNTNYRVAALAQIEGGDAYGLIEGFDADRNELIFKRIDSAANITEGAKVVTSGLGGIFPKGILVGEVTEITTDDNGLTKLAYVKPAANFSLLETVMVLRRSVTAIDGVDGTGTNEDITVGNTEEEGDE